MINAGQRNICAFQLEPHVLQIGSAYSQANNSTEGDRKECPDSEPMISAMSECEAYNMEYTAGPIAVCRCHRLARDRETSSRSGAQH